MNALHPAGLRTESQATLAKSAHRERPAAWRGRWRRLGDRGTFGWFASVLWLLALTPALCGAGIPPVEDHWYTIELAGQKAGHLHSRRTTSETTVTSDTAMLLKIKRGPVELKISMDSNFVETVDGKAVSMRTTQTLGALPVEQRYVFADSGVTVVTKQGGTESTSVVPKPEGVWYPPLAAEREFQRRFDAGETEVKLRTIDPSSSASPVEVTRRLVGPTRVTVLGREREAKEYSIVTSIAPGIVMKEISDAEGLMLKSETNLGGIGMTLILSSQAEAMGKTDAPELLLSTFVRPDRPIEEARTLQWAIYELFVDDGEMADLPAGGSQRTARQSAKVQRVVIDAASQIIAPDAEATNPVYVAPSSAADTKDEVIRKLVAGALADAPAEPRERAEVLRKLTHQHITKKNLGVGFGTASETVRSRAGDCTEHAVLLATMLRVDGIPSRVVSGVVYADQFAGERNIFGYHMWAQAMVKVDGYNKWVDLDAALSETAPFDATHLAFAYSDLSDATGVASMTQMVSLIGRVKIIVVETSADERHGK